jgi:hypothetical protein
MQGYILWAETPDIIKEWIQELESEQNAIKN